MRRGCGCERGIYCMFYCEQGNENHQVGAGYSILEFVFVCYVFFLTSLMSDCCMAEFVDLRNYVCVCICIYVIISAVKRVEFVGNRMLYIVQRGLLV